MESIVSAPEEEKKQIVEHDLVLSNVRQSMVGRYCFEPYLISLYN